MSKDPQFHRKDPHYKQAKRQGYRARSAYKLFDIQQRFNIFKRAYYILDIGSTPGSWLQVAKKFAQENREKYNDRHYHRDHFKIMGVDVKKVSPIDDVKIIKMDITNPEFKNEIKRYFQEKLDLIISDASIQKSGIKFSDNVRQINLCYKILDIAKESLKYKGNFVIKAFQGQDFNNFLRAMKNQFFYVKSYKPRSSRKGNEIYIIGQKKK